MDDDAGMTRMRCGRDVDDDAGVAGVDDDAGMTWMRCGRDVDEMRALRG